MEVAARETDGIAASEFETYGCVEVDSSSAAGVASRMKMTYAEESGSGLNRNGTNPGNIPHGVHLEKLVS